MRDRASHLLREDALSNCQFATVSSLKATREDGGGSDGCLCQVSMGATCTLK